MYAASTSGNLFEIHYKIIIGVVFIINIAIVLIPHRVFSPKIT